MPKNLSLFPKILLLVTAFILSALLVFTGLTSMDNGDFQNDTGEEVSYGEKSRPNSPASSPTATLTPTPDIFSGLPKEKFYITFYGWPDNDPPGYAIAYPRNRFSQSKHNAAGGLGTYSDPITFATNNERIKIGSIYYVPSFRKYIVMEDLCASCSPSENHIDIWMQSDSGFPDEVEKCQRLWTKKDIEVITKPTSNLPVNTTPFFDPEEGECM